MTSLYMHQVRFFLPKPVFWTATLWEKKLLYFKA